MPQSKMSELVPEKLKQPETIGCGKVMPRGVHDLFTLLVFMQHMAEQLGIRLRLYNFQSSHFFFGIKTAQGWSGTKARIDFTTDDGWVIYKLCKPFVKKQWSGQVVGQLQITALNPTKNRQTGLFPDNQQH